MVDREVERWQQRAQLLEKQYAELAQIAGSLAHEIKNPLSVIRMNMELVEEDLEESETPRERRVWTKLQTVHSQCQRLEKLLNTEELCSASSGRYYRRHSRVTISFSIRPRKTDSKN